MAIIFFLLILGGQLLFFENTDRYVVPEAPKPVVNPLKGWAPWVGTTKTEYPFTMEFVLMKWSDIEPEEGVYEFDRLEQELHMDTLREEGIRFIIRLVSDYPSDERHMDIPQWLYDKTYGDGTWYDNSYGMGYSPDYSNPVFIEEHGELLQAFAEYYGNDPYVAYVELGSLGHWGEWHVNYEAGITRFPESTVTDQYVSQYLSAFPSSKLLLRRPLDIGAENRLGLYNDSFGLTHSHYKWLDWIENGYISDQTGETLSGMSGFWQYAPSGGEFSSEFDSEYYFSEGFEETMELLRLSHTTFIGPHGVSGITDDSLSEQILQMSSEMGYCFRFNEVKLYRSIWGDRTRLTINIENTGIAPMYENWGLLLMVLDESGACVYENIFDIQSDKILPGETTVTLKLCGLTLEEGSYTIQAGLIDPITDKPGVSFANENETEPYLYRIMEFTK